MTLGIRNGEKRKTCQEDLVPYSSPLSHLTQYQIADNVQSHICQETLLKVPVQSTKCKSLWIAACKAEFLHHPSLVQSLHAPVHYRVWLNAQANALFL